MSRLIRILLQAIAAFEPKTVSDRAASIMAKAILRADEEGTMGHLTVAIARGCSTQKSVLLAETSTMAPPAVN